MDRATRKRFYNLCDPAEPLAPGDERYADVDALGVRGASWIEEVARRIELESRPVCELVTSPAGAGITTEMRRLAARLESGAGLLTVHIDADRVVDLWAPIDVADLLLAVLERTEQAVAARAGKPPPPEPMRRLRNWFLSPALEAASKTRSAGMMELLRDAPQAREKMRARVDADRSRFLSEIRDELTLLDDEARRLGRAGIAVLFDGLEKLSGTTSELAKVLDSVERVFGRDASAMSLPVHVFYTLPFALLLRLDGRAPLRVLPMIALTDREGRRREVGFQAVQAIVERRAPGPILDELFGPKQRAARVDQLIASSGGSPQQMVRLLQSILAASSLDGPRFVRLLAMDAEWLRLGIPESEAAWLARVHRSKTLDAASVAESRAAEWMLARGAVLPYRSHEAWFDVHPAVLRAPAVLAAMNAVPPSRPE